MVSSSFFYILQTKITILKSYSNYKLDVQYTLFEYSLKLKTKTFWVLNTKKSKRLLHFQKNNDSILTSVYRRQIFQVEEKNILGFKTDKFYVGRVVSSTPLKINSGITPLKAI